MPCVHTQGSWVHIRVDTGKLEAFDLPKEEFLQMLEQVVGTPCCSTNDVCTCKRASETCWRPCSCRYALLQHRLPHVEMRTARAQLQNHELPKKTCVKLWQLASVALEQPCC